MKIVQLEYFCAVSRYQSITLAAQKLYVTQPAISTAIRKLEKEFSISLFIRSKNRLTLTPEGEAFYLMANELLSNVNQTTERFYDLGRRSPPVRIGIPPLLSTVFFPDMLLEFQGRCPDVTVRLYEYASMRASALVQEELLDAALVNMHFPELGKVNAWRLRTEQVVFAVSRRHPLARESALPLASIEPLPVILYNTDSVLNATLNNLFAQAGIKLNVLMHASQLHTIERFVADGLGGAFLYGSLLPALPELTGIPLVPAVTQDVGLIWKKGRYINASAKKFIEFTKGSADSFTPKD